MRTSVIVCVLSISAVDAAGQTCPPGGDTTAAARVRRQTAIEFVMAINAAQAQLRRETGTYAPLHELRDLPLPLGFVPRLVSDPFGYVLKVTDALDSCGFTLFSDEHGVVFEAYPTRMVTTSSDPRLESPGQSSATDRARVIAH